MPIFSGVCGVLLDKALPIGMLSDDIRLEITFETSAIAVYLLNNCGNSISNH
jgi:hypothetical protein